MMLVQSIFIICSLVLWNQCTSYSLRHEIFEDEKAVEGVKLTKLTDIKEESSIEELKVAKLSKTNDELSFLHFSMFGKPYSFKLEPANSIFSQDFKILHSKQQDGDFENYQPLQKSEQLEGSFYTDENGRGSFYIQEKNGEIQMDGFVDDRVMISYSNGRNTATKILKVKSQFDRSLTHRLSKSSKSKTSSGKRDLQLDVATIEVLVFLDKIVHGKLVAKNTDIKKYLGIFWNTVQNKYKVFNNPKVEFSLSGAIVLSDMSWMVDTFLAPNKPDDEEYLESFANWLFKQDQKGTKINFPKYDVGVLHTGLDLSYKDGNRINPGTLGIAPLKGICADDAEHEVILSSCVFEDPYAPTFAGAMTAAHELGHLLSANHDDPSKCDKHGLMAPEDEQISPSTMVFCNSSIEQIKNELNSDAASCLYDSPKPHLPIGPEVPPMTREEICKSAYGDNFEAVPLNSYRRSIIDICVYVICFEDKNPENLQYLMWVPERTPCDDEKICIKGLCTTN